jgi:putative peptide zinc metalloprotease protein
MLNQASDQIISNSQRIAFIKQIKDFSLLNNDALATIMPYLTEYVAQPDDLIVEQGKVGRDIFLIASGDAKIVTDLHDRIELGELHQGDLIGLTDSALFARGRARQASIVAITDMRLLHFSRDALREFAKNYPELAYRVWYTAKQLQRESFIQVATPFSHLSYLRRCWLATRLEEQTVATDENIVKQGEVSDVCYFVRSGSVGLYALNANHEEELLETLTPGMLFGETAVLEKVPLPYTAKALCRCELWKLHSSDLKTMVFEAENSAEAVMNMMEYRSLPQQAPDIAVYENVILENEEVTILKDTKNSKYFRLSQVSSFLWPFLDGTRNLRQLTIMTFKQFGIFIPGLIANELRTLSRAQFITGYTQELQTKNSNTIENKIYSGLARLKSIAEKQWAIGNIQQRLQNLYDKGAKHLFHPLSFLAMSTLGVIGLILLFAITPHILASHIKPATFLLLFFIIAPLSMITAIFHELAHAFATLHSGREVNRVGVGWYWIGPIAFVDTSDMWLAPRLARFKVNIAGIYIDFTMAGILLIPAMLLIASHPLIAASLWLLSLMLYMRIFANFNPMLEFDGYYALMDITNKPNLRQSSVLWLINIVPRTFKNPTLLRDYWLEPIYWLCCLIFLVVSVYFGIWFATAIAAKILPFEWFSQTNIALRWLIPILLVTVASATVYAEARLLRTKFRKSH